MGVALFMVLSGFLFAQLLDGKRIAWRPFYYNRAARLLPLLIVAITLNMARGWTPASDIAVIMIKGFVLPTWPGGAWSIAVEAHFYLLLPALLWLIARGTPKSLLSVVAAGIAIRAAFPENATWLGYWTIVGRIDQFAAGMLAWHYRHHFTQRHTRVALSLAIFTSLVWMYDLHGGLGRYFYGNFPLYVSILMPTLLGAGFAILVVWYATSFSHGTGTISTAVARAGQYSYSIYLLHVFFVFELQLRLTRIIPAMEHFLVALSVALLCFIAFVPFAGMSYRYIEEPFLRRRKIYTISDTPPK